MQPIVPPAHARACLSQRPRDKPPAQTSRTTGHCDAAGPVASHGHEGPERADTLIGQVVTRSSNCNDL
jgi:hypothetical protein